MPAWTNPLENELDLTFIEAIARGWGISFNCKPCGEYRNWTDADLATRFIHHLDKPMSILRGPVSCPECGDREKLSIHAYQAGAMNWRSGTTPVSDMLAMIEAHKVELREMVKAQRS